MATENTDEWFEFVEKRGIRIRHASKFLQKNFNAPVEMIMERWSSWTLDEKIEFAGAFAARGDLNNNDRNVLRFLMEHGEPPVWSTIALSVARHPDRTFALNFLLERVTDGIGPIANYYQALEILAAPESVPVLKEALMTYREKIMLGFSPRVSSDRFFYLDYLSCTAALFKLTGDEEYWKNLQEMKGCQVPEIKRTLLMVARSSGILLEPELE
jgi:hypothetical protein